MSGCRAMTRAEPPPQHGEPTQGGGGTPRGRPDYQGVGRPFDHGRSDIWPTYGRVSRGRLRRHGAGWGACNRETNDSRTQRYLATATLAPHGVYAMVSRGRLRRHDAGLPETAVALTRKGRLQH